LFTPASNACLKNTVAKTWTVAGMGVSKPLSGFAPLHSVEAELSGIVRTGKAGVLPGKVYLNEAFTQSALKGVEGSEVRLVHVATHFAFKPGTERDSGLLLGDGSLLSVGALREMGTLFADVDLLTLSACETGLGTDKNADGREIESVAVIAQESGAKAVLATLWKVADESASLLMQAFYQERVKQPNLSKAEALRRAQVALLTGKIKPSVKSGKHSGRGGETAVAPNRPHDFAHPYYWAPFILTGNWK
jgi:CHAT domain-containing protein